jgi:hypothetical protein
VTSYSEANDRAQVLAALRPLAIDIGLPLGSYYLLHNALGVSIWLSLALSSIGPVVRTCYSVLAERKPNILAALMLAVNVAGIIVSLLTGDPRQMIAKDSLISSVIAIAILASVAAGRPLMSAALKPYMTRGVPRRVAAWENLAAGSARFRHYEKVYSAIWGVTSLAACVAQLIGAYTLPISRMVWLSTVMTLAAIGLAIVVSGVAAAPIESMIQSEIGGGREAVAGR